MKMKEDGVLDDLVAKRYSSYKSGVGAEIESGKATFQSLEAYSLDKTQADLRAATHSDHLEQVKDTINHYIVDTLSK